MLFTLAFNPSVLKENVSNFISKIVVIRELSFINLYELSIILAAMHIKELNIFSLDHNLYTMKIVKRDKGCSIHYS